ncbi:interferon alpha-inducible protein 27-like protein 2B isoform X1 [Pungitius pungitius]|uniref:interferon alpha-inducible protein 27-like protein 2B isoform X1 n=1 Tax=Pungitius pungitius TaxID=134920 RepID=UPI002E11A724
MDLLICIVALAAFGTLAAADNPAAAMMSAAAVANGEGGAAGSIGGFLHSMDSQKQTMDPSVGAGAVAAVAAAPVVLGAVGFNPAAAMMSAAAVANGEGGAAGSSGGFLHSMGSQKQTMDLCTALAVGAGAVVAVAAAPVVLGAVGFTSAGITAGSYAATMMSVTAVANGGAVAAGSTVAALQAAGAAGLSGTATAAVAAIGAAVGYMADFCGSPN